MIRKATKSVVWPGNKVRTQCGSYIVMWHHSILNSSSTAKIWTAEVYSLNSHVIISFTAGRARIMLGR